MCFRMRRKFVSRISMQIHRYLPRCPGRIRQNLQKYSGLCNEHDDNRNIKTGAKAVANGGKGVIIHGLIRDSADIKAMDLGVKVLGTRR
ncbi:MAG: hypothetical protein CSB47_05465 [Proteobacteria bacterium]|nr:MAG: hypothetical protein CSB47_05465 [Pseudomonadota bacterium]